MKDWYGGRRVNPFDNMSAEGLRTMYADVKEAHQVITRWRDEAEAEGANARAFVLNQERKRLAGIGAEIQEYI